MGSTATRKDSARQVSVTVIFADSVRQTRIVIAMNSVLGTHATKRGATPQAALQTHSVLVEHVHTLLITITTKASSSAATDTDSGILGQGVHNCAKTNPGNTSVPTTNNVQVQMLPVTVGFAQPLNGHLVLTDGGPIEMVAQMHSVKLMAWAGTTGKSGAIVAGVRVRRFSV